jgi:predicted nuclease of predicted toxin-antitoxin system
MNDAFSFFADENISPELIEWLKQKGYLVFSVSGQGMNGTGDDEIIKRCFANREIIITQDSDFGQLIFSSLVPFYIVIYLRPGHFDGRYHLPTIEKILDNKEKLLPRTIIVGSRKNDLVRIRIKQVP